MDSIYPTVYSCLSTPFDWVALDPKCSREISRLVDQEQHCIETIAEILDAQEAGR